MIDAVRETGLLAASRPVLVMLSGGRDSVCLLDLAVRIAGANRTPRLPRAQRARPMPIGVPDLSTSAGFIG